MVYGYDDSYYDEIEASHERDVCKARTSTKLP